MSGPSYADWDLEQLQAHAAAAKAELAAAGETERLVRARLHKIQEALATKLPDYGGVFGRLPGKVVRETQLLPLELDAEFPAMLVMTFTDESKLHVQVFGRVDVWDEPLREQRGVAAPLVIG